MVEVEFVDLEQKELEMKVDRVDIDSVVDILEELVEAEELVAAKKAVDS